jgi:hypothetical protein
MRRSTLARRAITRRATVLLVVALVGCSDHSPTPTAPATPPTRLPRGGGYVDSIISLAGKADPKPLADRVADLVSARLAKVALPPDNYSLSSDAVHPDVACGDQEWNGARCWLMYTPYKNGNAGYENPALLMVANDTTWTTPAAITNPIVPWPGVGAYNSDPDHAFEPGTHRLTEIYRVVAEGYNKIMIMSTTNARTWTPARIAFKEANHDAISPSLIIEDDHTANVWYVRAGVEGCDASKSTVVMRTAMPDSGERIDQATWSAAKTVNLSILGSVIWHLDVESLPGGRGYVALVVAYPRGSGCASSDLWLATSSDGINWRTFAMPLMWRGMAAARKRSISTWYRGTLQYDERTDSLHVWPSGLSGPNWTIFHTAFKLSDMLGLLSAAQPGDLKALAQAQAGIRAMVAMP